MKKKFLKRLPDLIFIFCLLAYAVLFELFGEGNYTFCGCGYVLLGVVYFDSGMGGYRDGWDDAAERFRTKTKSTERSTPED